MSPNGDCPSLGARGRAPGRRGKEARRMRRCGRRPHRSNMHCICREHPWQSWDTRWMSGSMRCTWASIGCGRGASVAGPGWIQRVSGVDVRGRVQSLTRRSITSQAMTAGELPLSKARPRSGCEELRRRQATDGNGVRIKGRRSSVAKNGPDRAARAQTSTCFRDPGVRSCRRSSDRVIQFARGGQLDGWAGVMPLERTTGQPTMSQHRRRLDR